MGGAKVRFPPLWSLPVIFEIDCGRIVKFECKRTIWSKFDFGVTTFGTQTQALLISKTLLSRSSSETTSKTLGICTFLKDYNGFVDNPILLQKQLKTSSNLGH